MTNDSQADLVAAVARAVPILSVRDLDEAVAFYALLGFAVGSRYDDQGYAILEHGAVELHLSRWPSQDPERNNGMVYLRVTDVVRLYEHVRDALERDGLLYLAPASGLTPELAAQLRARVRAGERLIRLHELEDKTYGVREFAVVDPSGNLVRAGQRH